MKFWVVLSFFFFAIQYSFSTAIMHCFRDSKNPGFFPLFLVWWYQASAVVREGLPGDLDQFYVHFPICGSWGPGWNSDYQLLQQNIEESGPMCFPVHEWFSNIMHRRVTWRTCDNTDWGAGPLLRFMIQQAWGRSWEPAFCQGWRCCICFGTR